MLCAWVHDAFAIKKHWYDFVNLLRKNYSKYPIVRLLFHFAIKFLNITLNKIG